MNVSSRYNNMLRTSITVITSAYGHGCCSFPTSPAAPPSLINSPAERPVCTSPHPTHTRAPPHPGSPVCEAVGGRHNPAGLQQEAPAVVLALETHGCHVGPGVGGHLVAPDDSGCPGACRQGGQRVRDGAVWGRGQAGRDRQTQRCPEKAVEFARRGAGCTKSWARAWPRPQLGLMPASQLRPERNSHAGG